MLIQNHLQVFEKSYKRKKVSLMHTKLPKIMKIYNFLYNFWDIFTKSNRIIQLCKIQLCNNPIILHTQFLSMQRSLLKKIEYEEFIASILIYPQN